MTDPFARLRRFLRELKRRKVYRVAATYAVVVFVTLQAARLIFPATTLEGLYDKLVVLAFVGFPIAVVLAWAFEVTPEGVRRTGTPEAEGPEQSGAYQWIGLAVVVSLASGVWYVTAGDSAQSPSGTAAAGMDTARAGNVASADSVTPRLGDRSIAVLPFEALGKEEPGTFTEGMHDALLTRLSNISELTVISRTAVQQFRDTDVTTRQIADSLGVRWVLEGGVQEMSEQIQVNAQLIDPRTEGHKWADRYRRDLTAADLFVLQSEITKKIARSLEAELSPAEENRVGRRPTEDLDAYRLYVQGRTHLDRRTEEGLRRGQEFFRRAIARDSSYALAWSGLADARALLIAFGHASGDTLWPRALESARRALEIDRDLGEAHASAGLIHLNHRRDGPAALRELQRAVELKPSYARAYHWLGVTYQILGRPGPALARLERAAELDPMSPSIQTALSYAYRYAGRFQTALDQARRAEELAPGLPATLATTGLHLTGTGRHEEAIARFRRVLERMDPSPIVAAEARAWLAIAHHRAGDTVHAEKLLARIEGSGENPFMAGLVHAGSGDSDAAIDALQRGDFDFSRTTYLALEPVLDPLRDDPRYRELIREVNRQWGLNPDGSLPDSVDVSFDAQADE